ncbi:MAG: hypothetical protein ACFE0P_04865 [Oceanicaulis sp.]
MTPSPRINAELMQLCARERTLEQRREEVLHRGEPVAGLMDALDAERDRLGDRIESLAITMQGAARHV